ncbi:exopolysaccharide biosynthesis protein [Hansschlegelia quercus]|uniref:exopolysaccharide biosynthesis protein n=1 Tax=Hansschlegelia quercus TaxID=2528245 RepID=UPI00247A1E9E|nr:exopolysaccharide biosynthesis protein [Hansschlegelia quercus]
MLRNVLAKNPDVQSFSIGDILDSIGTERVETSLMLFSVSAFLPAPGAPAFSPRAAAAVGAHFAAGRTEFKLPKAILEKQVPRRSLAVAIHALLPVMEFAEKRTRARLAWTSHPVSRWIVGVLVFILAATIAFPVIGFDPLHAMSIFVISLGLAEKDGLAIILGVIAGLLSLGLVALSGVNLRALRSKIGKWVGKLTRRLGFRALANYCQRRGWERLAAILRFEWADLLLAWDPERRAGAEAGLAETAGASDPSIARRSIKSARSNGRAEAAKARDHKIGRGQLATA